MARIMLDKSKRGWWESAVFYQIYPIPLYSVVDVYDIIEYLEEDPANEENVTRIKNYLAVNGAK